MEQEVQLIFLPPSRHSDKHFWPYLSQFHWKFTFCAVKFHFNFMQQKISSSFALKKVMLSKEVAQHQIGCINTRFPPFNLHFNMIPELVKLISGLPLPRQFLSDKKCVAQEKAIKNTCPLASVFPQTSWQEHTSTSNHRLLSLLPYRLVVIGLRVVHLVDIS